MTTAATNLAELKQTSKMMARDAGVGSVKKFFESQKATLLAVLPKHMDAERMLKIALGALRTTPKLMNCTVESLFGAVVQCSQLGLEPNTPLGHAYLIPFDNRQKGVTEVQIVFGYKGLIDLSRRSGQIVSITAHEVCEKDAFDFAYGLNERLDHKPALGERGQVIAFYAVAKLVGGGYAFEVMSKGQIEEIRDASQNYKFARDKAKTVWGQHFVEMGRKTVLRRLFKYLPVSIEVATAAALEGRATDGHSQGLDNVLTGEYSVVDDDTLQISSDAGDGDGTESAPDDVDTSTGEVLSQQQFRNAMQQRRQAEPVRVNDDRSDASEPEQFDQINQPTLEEALDFVKKGDPDMARDIARSLSEKDQAIVEQTINNQQASADRPRRQRNLE